jgi:hypothetical protein
MSQCTNIDEDIIKKLKEITPVLSQINLYSTEIRKDTENCPFCSEARFIRKETVDIIFTSIVHDDDFKFIPFYCPCCFAIWLNIEESDEYYALNEPSNVASFLSENYKGEL